MSDSDIDRAFNSLQRLLTVIDPDYGESRWQRAHDFEALPATQRKPGHWYRGPSGHDFIHVDENLNGQWHKELPPGVDEDGVIELPRLNTPSLLESLKSLIQRLPAEQGDTRKRLEDLLTNLTALSQPEHPRVQVQKFRQEAFAAFQAGQSLLLEFLDKSAEHFSGHGLANGQVTGIEAGAVLLLRELARTIATPRADGSQPPPFQLARALGMLSAPGSTSFEMMAGQFVRDCLSNGFTDQTLAALAKLQSKANEAVESAREGLYPVGHPEMMLDLYYFGLFLAAPYLRAVMVGYEVLGTKSGNDEARRRYSIWANAAEEKLVRISDAMLFAIRDLDGSEARRRRDEIQALIQAGQAEKAQGLAMSLVDLQLFFPKPFKSVLLKPSAS